jgi:uncharacterized protein YbcC (UPF0753/DUF2309 family)
VFIHHNTLHAFEDERFEDAVAHAAARFGCEPFLSEDVYREDLRRGRIAERDVDAAVSDELGARADEPILADLPRRELWRRLVAHGFPEARGVALAWLLDETDALARLRDDLPGDARQLLAPGAGALRDEEQALVGELWRACREAIGRSRFVPAPPAPRRARHRDLVFAACGIDTDEWTRPVQIRFVGAFLDQGLAHWAMPERDRGLYACFVALYGRQASRLAGAWARELVALIAEDRAAGRDATASLGRSLEDLGVPEERWEEALVDEALWLRGWAGMVRQIETRPDRVPVMAVPARLVDYLAVQLLLSRAALRHAVRAGGLGVKLAEIQDALGARVPRPGAPTEAERAWPLLHVAELCGLSPARVAALREPEITGLETELAELDGLARRRVLHLAYERHLRHRFYDALLAGADATPAKPELQVITCLDEREESFRRHLEEVSPGAETFGAAGFFGVAMYYRGAHAAHARPLCPVAIQPSHYVVEEAGGAERVGARLERTRRKLVASVDKGIHVGSRTFGRGAVISALLGTLYVVPLVLHVVFPWFRRSLQRFRVALPGAPSPRLSLDRAPGPPPLGEHFGFTVEESARIVHGLLRPLGIGGRFAPVVLVLGHGSTSLNNPQESAHDCGACGGGRGGPNARAFAQMANDERVRARVAELGLEIPPGTWFVGGQRNTANNDVDLFDTDRVPAPLRADFENAREVIEIVRRREAHERCRRFESAPAQWLPDVASLVHVQARAADLAQPRPEYGHATNAACVIGRRARTRGLFLDRRAFLVSYDPTRDPDGSDLAGLLRAVVPVVAGISLEYFFGYVDPTGYGCGTKLPHNVATLLGVMDGAQSDLRTGLPWQMLEIHEPVRLAIAVEAKPEVLARLLERDEALARLVRGRWIFLAALDPDAPRLVEIDASGARAYAAEAPVLVVAGASRAHYAGRRGHLPFARIEATP